MDNLFAGLISSKTRIKLLVRFFFNPRTQSYLRELAKEFNVSTNSVRKELNQLTKTTHRDRLLGTPLHRYVPCRVEKP